MNTYLCCVFIDNNKCVYNIHNLDYFKDHMNCVQDDWKNQIRSLMLVIITFVCQSLLTNLISFSYLLPGIASSRWQIVISTEKYIKYTMNIYKYLHVIII